MRRFLPAILLAACSSDPPASPGPDATPDAAPEASADAMTHDAAPDSAADAPLEAAMDAVAVGDAALDAPAPTDAAPTSEDAVAVADASRDVPPDRYSCADEGAPRCSDHGACAVCLPAADGTTWCCRSGFCRPAPDRSTCE